MSYPLISVVMPVYNCENYISKAIDSILEQSYTFFEFIIVNDGSTDRTNEIILSYKDERIKYIYQTNSGIGSALKNGCDLAQGQFIARMDADDISEKHRLQTQLNFLLVNRDYCLISSAVHFIDEYDQIFSRSYPYTGNKAIKLKLFHGSTICHPSAMMRKDIYLKAGGYRDLSFLEDLYLWKRMVYLGKFHNIPKPLLKYRILSSSISSSVTDGQYKYLLKTFANLISKNNNTTLCIEDEIYLKNLYKFFTDSNKINDLKINRKIIPNNKFEISLVYLFKLFSLNDLIVEFILCNLKSFYIITINLYKFKFKNILSL